MAYLFGLVIVVLFFGVMHFFTELNVRQKLLATLLVLAFVMGALYYNALQEKDAAHLRDVMLRFNQGQSLRCNGQEVTKADFTLSEGTQTFIGNRATPHAGTMIPASECE